jgi:RecA-family ATPase
MLDYPEDCARLIADLKSHGSEFLILDVMRVLHGAEENDPSEMQKIINELNKIQEGFGGGICLIHHSRKNGDGEDSLTESARGASSIAGWAEFVCGVGMVDEEEHIRIFRAELKAAEPPPICYFKILDTADAGVKLERVEYTPPSNRGRKRNETNADVPF